MPLLVSPFTFDLVPNGCSASLLLGANAAAIVVVSLIVGVSGPLGLAADKTAVPCPLAMFTRCCCVRLGAAVAVLSGVTTVAVVQCKQAADRLVGQAYLGAIGCHWKLYTVNGCCLLLACDLSFSLKRRDKATGTKFKASRRRTNDVDAQKPTSLGFSSEKLNLGNPTLTQTTQLSNLPPN